MINGGLYMRRGDRMIWRAFLAFLSAALTGGIFIYMYLMIFIILTIGLAKIILKFFMKQPFKYTKLLIFCVIGLGISILLSIFKISLPQKYLESAICIILNIIIYKYIMWRKNIKCKKNLP